MEQVTAETTAVQHTPGRWRALPFAQEQRDMNGERFTAEGFRIRADGDERTQQLGGVEYVADVAPSHYAEANARLIAAAPDMLSALQLVLIALDPTHPEYGDYLEAEAEDAAYEERTPSLEVAQRMVLRRAQLAIAAATGSAVRA